MNKIFDWMWLKFHRPKFTEKAKLKEKENMERIERHDSITKNCKCCCHSFSEQFWFIHCFWCGNNLGDKVFCKTVHRKNSYGHCGGIETCSGRYRVHIQSYCDDKDKKCSSILKLEDEEDEEDE